MTEFKWSENPVNRYYQWLTERDKINYLLERGYTNQAGWAEMSEVCFRKYITEGIKTEEELDSVLTAGPCVYCEDCDDSCSMKRVIDEVRKELQNRG